MSSFKYTNTDTKLFDKLFIYRYTIFTLVEDLSWVRPSPPHPPPAHSLSQVSHRLLEPQLLQHLRGLNQASLCKQYLWKQELIVLHESMKMLQQKIDQCITCNKKIVLKLSPRVLMNFKPFNIEKS